MRNITKNQRSDVAHLKYSLIKRGLTPKEANERIAVMLKFENETKKKKEQEDK